MDERVLRFRVGVVVVAATALAVLLIIMMGEWRLPFSGDYTLHIGFPEAPGVTVGTPVRRGGVRIGRVTNIELIEPEGVRITVRIDGQRQLNHSQTVRVSSQSVLGDAVLEFVSGIDPTKAKTPIVNGDYLEGVVGSSPFDAIVNLEDDLTRAVEQFTTAGSEVTALARNLNQVVDKNQEQLHRVLLKTETALDEIQLAMRSVNEITADPELRDGMKRALTEVPMLVEESRAAIAEARQTFEGFNRVTMQAEKNLQDLEGLTRPLGERGESIVGNINSSVQNLDTLLAQLAQFSESLNSREGTLGMLVHDPDLYLKLNRTAGNLEDASRRVEQIVADVRVFSDKIARDPKQLGVRGALDRRQSGLKTPHEVTPTGFEEETGGGRLFETFLSPFSRH